MLVSTTANSPLALLSDFLGRGRGWLESRLNNRWYSDAAAPWMLQPLSVLYARVADRLKQRQLAQVAETDALVPTIVVGNIVAGGTGKTPTVMRVVAMLVEAGYSPGVVTRGYGGQAKCWPRVVTADSNPFVCGDEAVELAALTGVPVVAAPRRTAAVRWLNHYFGCDVVVSDDGLQHYALPRGLELALVDATRQFGNGARLPAGPLREPIERLAEVNAVLIVGRASVDLLPAKDEVAQTLAGRVSAARLPPMFCCKLEASSVAPLVDGQAQPPSEAPFVGKPVTALSGIAHPERFHLDLQGLGCRVTPVALADHQNYDRTMLQRLLRGIDGPIVTTEKDAVKLRRLARQAVSWRAEHTDASDCWWERVWVMRRRAEMLPSDDRGLRNLVVSYCAEGQHSQLSAEPKSSKDPGEKGANHD